MKKFQTIALMTAIALTGTTGFSACSSNDFEEEKIVYDDNGTAGVKSEFVISLPRKVLSITRMSDNVTQNAGTVGQFRGIDNIRLIPFAAEPTNSTAKLADIMRLSAVPSNGLSEPGSINYKVYSDKFVPIGTKNFLFYGRAISSEAEKEVSTMSDKFHYGILKVDGLEESTDWTPGKILFSLEQINTSTAAQANDETGERIVKLMTELANLTVSGAESPHNAWSSTTNLVLATLYKRFKAITTSSSNSLAVVLSKLYYAVDNVQTSDKAHKLVGAIKDKIMTACSSTPINGLPASLKAEYDGYPANIGLPDGAVRVRWDATSSKFKDVTANYGKGYNLKMTDYCYPAALWYYTSSPIKAANEKKSSLYDEAGTWEGVINSVYNGTSDEVGPGTQSVALRNAADYGVGRLETSLTMGTGDFYDANGNVVNTGSGYKLTGLLLGGQTSVRYNFTPKGSENLTIYDRDITNTILVKPGYTTTSNQTLALETGNGQVINAALELTNGGDEFRGADGIIPANGTFYLAVKLDPAEAINKDEVNIDQIIKQDYVTQLIVTIKNGATSVDRDGDGKPDKYVKDSEGNIIGVDTGDGTTTTEYDINGDGEPDKFISDPDLGGPGWDTDGDNIVDIPIIPDNEGNYPDAPTIPEGLGNATNGIPDLTSPGIELGTSFNLEWRKGLKLQPNI